MRPFLLLLRGRAQVVALILAALAGAVSQAATLTWDTVAGDGGIITGGTGTWTDGLGNWNTGSGDTLWNSATPDSAIFGGTAGTVTLGGGVTVGNMVFNSAYTLAGGGNTLTLSNSTVTTNANVTLSATLGGSTGLTKDGTGALGLAGTNTYTGATTINNGVVNVTLLANGGSSSNIGASSNAAENLVLNGGTLQYANTITASTDRLFSIGASGGTIGMSVTGTLNFTNTGNIGFNGETGARTLTFAFSNVNAGGVISMASGIGDNGGATSVVKANTFGTLRLTSDNNTYTGTTTIQGGAISIGTVGGSTGSIGTGEIIINSGGTLFVSRSGSVNLAQTISGAGGVTSNGNTALTLSGSNTYTGVTRIISNGGVVTVSDLGNGGVASNIGASSSAAGNLSITNLGTLKYVGAGTSTDRLFEVTTGTANPVATIDASGTGALVFTNTGAMGFGSTTGARTLVLSGTNTQDNTMTPVIGDNSGATALTKSGSGKWVLAGNNTYTGVTTVSSGVLQVGNGGTSGTLGSGAVTNNGNLTFNRSDSMTVANTISGSGSVSQTGTGTTTLSGTNSYVGVTTISGGVLSVATLANGGSTSNIGASSNAATSLVLNGGALQYTGAAVNTDRLFSVGTSGGSVDASGTGALTFTNSGSMGFNGQSGARTLTLTGSSTANNIVAAVIGDSGGATALAKTGAGTWTLTGANNYTGVTTINGGVLNVLTLANGGSNSSIGASGSAATNLVLNGGTLKYSSVAGSAVSTDRLFSVGTSGGAIDASGGFNINFTNTGSMGFNGQSGARTLTLTGINANDNTLAAVIGDNGGATSVTKAGGGAWVLSGANTYTGVTTVSGTGVLKVSSLADGGVASSIGASSNAASNLVLNGGTFTYTGGAVSTDRLFSLGTSGIILNVFGTGGVTFTNTGSMGFNGQSGARTLTLANSLSGTSTIAAVIGDNGGATSVTRTGTGTWALTGANTYTGATTLNGTGVLSVTSLANGGSASNIGAATNDATNLVLNGGTLQYTGAATSTDRLFSVGTSGGTLNASGTGAVNFTNTGSMGFNAQTGTRTLTLTGTNTGNNILAAVIGDNGGATSMIKSGAGTWVLTGNNTYTGTTTISAGTLALGNGGSTGSISGDIINNGTLLLNNTTGLTLSQTISGTGGITVTGGSSTLSGTNTYTGVTSIVGGVSLTVTTLANGGAASNLGAASSAASNIILNNGYLRYAGAGSTTDRLFSVGLVGGGLVSSGTGAVNFTNTGSIGYNNQTGIRNFTLTGTNTGANTLAASIGDNGGATILYKDGAGTWILTGTNGFSGGTTISDGLLQIGNGGTSGAIGSGAVINNSKLTFNRSDAFTASNIISGTGTLTQAGTGTVTLSGTSTYTGVTVINAGVVKITFIANGGSNSNLGASSSAASNLVLNGGALQYAGTTASTDRLFSVGTNGGTLDASGTGAVNFTNTGSMGFNSQTGARTLTLTGTNAGSNILAAVIGDNSGATALAKSGAGTWVLTGTNTYTGTTTINAGVLQVGNGGTAGTLGSGAVTDNGSLSFNRSDTVTISNNISGSGALIQAGAGTTILTGTNGYSGGTTISAGTLQVGNGGTTGTVGSGSIINNGTLIINRSDAITISGTMSGTGALIQNGTGTTTLSGISNSWGSATVNAGILSAGVASGLGTTSAMIVNSGGTLATNGNPLGSAVGSISGSGIVQNGSSNNSGLVVSGNVSSTFSGVLQDGGTGTLFLTKMGAITTLTLSGNNTYTGATTITGGTLSISTLADGGSASNIGASSNAASNLILNNASAVLKYTGAAVSTDRLFSIGSSSGTLDASGTGAVNFTNTGSMGFNGQTGARTLTLTGTNTGSNTIAAVIGDNTGATALTKSGAGTWVLTGTNTYSGVTTISGGVLSVTTLANGAASSGIGAASNVATNLILNGGTLLYTGAGASTDRLFSVGTSGGTVDSSGSGALNLTNTGNMGFNGQSGARTLTLTGTNTGNNIFNAGIGDNGGATALTKSGSGTWTLTGFRTYTGVTTINGGVLSISSLVNGGSQTPIGAATNAAANLVLNGGTLQYTGIGGLTDRLFSVGTSGGTLNMVGTGGLTFTNTGSMGFNGQTGARTLTLGSSNGGSSTIAAVIGDNGGATSVTHTTSGFWILTGANTYTGATTVTGGTLSTNSLANAGSASGIGAATSAATNLVMDGGSLQYTGIGASTNRLFSVGTGGGALESSGSGAVSFTGAGSMGFNGQSGARTLTLTGTNTGSNSLAVVIGDNGGATALTKDGAGTWTLTGTNTYTGVTTISAGLLGVNTLANGGSASSMGAASNAATNLVLNGGGLNYAGFGSSTDRLFSLGTNGGVLNSSGSAAVHFTNTGSMDFNGQSGARTLTLGGTNSNDNSLAAVIGDNGGATTVIKQGVGIWGLSGTSTYTGTTTISAGYLEVFNLANGGVASNIGSSSNAAANLVLSGGGLYYLGSGSSTDRLFTLGTGTSALQASGTGAINFTNTGSIALSGSGTRSLLLSGTSTAANTLASALGDNGGATSVNKSGTGTWVLSGANTYTGGTTISGGVLQVGDGGTAGTLGTGAVTNSASLIINRSDAITLANSISGIGTFTQAGGGTTTFTGSKSYTGATFVNAGKLQAGGSNTFSIVSAVTVASGAVLEVNGFNNNVGGLAGAGTVQNGTATGATLNVLGSGTSTFSGLIQDGGSAYLSLNKGGIGGTLTLTGSNTYTGGTVVSAGTLSIATLANGGVASNIGASTNAFFNLLLNGGTLSYTGAAVSTDRLFSVTTNGGALDASGTGVVSFTNTGSMGFNFQTGARTLTLTGTGGGSIAAIIGDNGGATALTKTGAGQWALSGANGYTGITTITGGQLAVSSLANGGSASGIGAATSASTNLILNGGVLRYTGAAVSTDRLFSVGTSGGTLDASGTGAVNFTNTGSMGFNGQTGARTLTLNGDNTGNNTLAAIIGDNGGATSLVKLATSTWVLTGANTYTGSTRIDLGMLIISSLANGGVASNIGASSSAAGNLILGLATLKYTGAAVSTDRLFSVGTSGGTLDASGTGAVNFTNTGSMGFNSESGARVLFLQGSNTGSNTLAAVIGDNGGATSVYKNGNGFWVLSGANTYTGINLINAGTLSVASLANGGSASNLGVSTNAATNLVLNGGALKYTGGTVSTDRLFSVGTSGGTLDASGSGMVNFSNTGSMGFNSQSGARTLTLTGTNAGNNTLAAAIGDNGGATSLVKSGTGTWVLTGTNTYSGTTTISGGVLQVGNGGTSGTLGSGAVTDNANLVINHSNAITLANTISGSGSLFKQGSGTTTLTGANSYTGSTTISAGVLSVASLANGGSSSNLGASTNDAANLVLNGGVLQYTGAAASTDRLFSVGTNGGTLDASGTGAVNFTNTGSMGFNSQSGTRTLTLTGANTGNNTLAAVIGDNGGATSLVKSGTGTWVLTGNNTYTGTTTISGGVLQVGSGSTTGSLGSGAVINNGSLVINHSDDVTLANSISGAGSLTQAGTGTTTLGSSNSYTGATIINSGVLNVTVFANGGSNSSIGAALSAAGNLVIDGGTLEYSGSADVSTDRLFSVGIGSAVIDVTGSGAVNFTNTGAMGFNGQSGDRNLLLTGTNTGANIIAAAIGDFGGATSVTIDGDATWKLTGANSYTGATTLSAGVLQIGGSNLDSAIILGSKATLELNGLDTRIGSLAGSGKVQNNSTAAATLTTGGNNTNTTFSGVLQDGGTGALSLVKTGSGTFTLTGANTYTGTTTISGGVLQVGSGGTSGALGAGAVTNNASLVINRSNAILLTNDISGSGSFVQAGSGTTTLSGTNSYTGSTTINAGVLSVSVLADGGSSSQVGASTSDAANLVLNGGTLQYTGADVSTDRLFSVGTNGGTLDASGTGAMNFTNTGSMGFNGQDGIRTLTLTGTNTGDNTLAAVIGDNGGATALTKSGTGTWVLTGASTYSGITAINDGVLQIGAGGTTGSIGTGAVINNGSLIINRSDDITLVNDISGTGSFTQEGAGTTTLTGDSSYTGGTTINGGTLSVSVLADGGSNSNLGASTSDAANLVLNGGTLQYTGGDVSTDRLFSVGSSGATLDASGSGVLNLTNTGLIGFNGQSGTRTLTLTGTNTGGNTLAAVLGDNDGASVLIKSGAGTWVLTGDNSYTGTTTINAGELQIGSGGTTGTLGSGAVINNGSLVINRSDALTMANEISGSGVFTQAGAGTTTLSGDNSYSGSTTISAGVLSVSVLADGGVNSNLGVSSNAAGNLVLNGGTLQYTGAATSTDRLFNVGTSGGTLDASGTGAVKFTNNGSLDFNGQSGARTLILTGTNTDGNTLAAVIGNNDGATALTKSGSGTWVLTAANTYTGATTISGGTLQIGDGGTTGSLSTSSAISNNGTLVFNRSNAMTQGTEFASVISGSGGVTQDGGGTLTLNGQNTYEGATHVRAGTLEVTSNNALGTSDAGTTVSSGATLLLNNVNYSTSEALALNGSGASNGGALRNSGTSTYTGQITAETNASINAGGGVLNLTGGLVKDGTVLSITGGGVVNVSETGISGASASSDLVVDGTTLVVSADSDYNGPTTVHNGAALVANAAVKTTQLELSSNSELAGTGSITAAMNESIFMNGTFRVGDPAVTAMATSFALTTSGTGAVVMGAGSVIRLDLFSGASQGNNLSNAAAADSINLHGLIDASAGGTVVIGNPNGMTRFHGGDQWQLVHLNTGDANAGGFISQLALNDSSLHLASGVTSYLDQSTGIFSIIDTNGGLALAAVEGQALISAGNTVTSDLNGHLFNLRNGGGEEGGSGSIAAALDEGVIVGEGDGDPEQKASPIAKRVARTRQWEVFATVNYGNIKLNPIRTQSGVQVDSWASGAGVERHLTRGVKLGFAASFLQSTQGYAGNLGSLYLEGPALSTYLSYVRGGFWNSLLYSFGTYQMDSTRNPGAPFATAHGSTRTYTHSVQYNTGWNFRFQDNTLVTGPFVGVDYLHGSVDAYSETGGGLAALHYSAQSYQSLVSRVGWSASKQIKTRFAMITPQLRLSYERQNIRNNNGTSVSLINVPFTSVGGGQTPGQDYLVAGLGVSLAFTERFSLMLSYQGQFFRHDLQAHFGSIRFNYQF